MARRVVAAAAPLRRAVAAVPRRHAMVALVGSCSVLNYADRVNLSVAVIPMAAAFRWDAPAQGVVLSAFFWGYAPAQLLGAAACRRWGAVRVLAAAAAAWSLFTAATPAAASAGWAWLLACRILLGLGEGMAFPTFYHFISGWVLPHERGRAVALLLLGVHVGTTVALLGSPRILAVAGWPAIFYVFGVAGAAWVAMWLRFARDAPPSGGPSPGKAGPGGGDVGGGTGQWAPLPTTDGGGSGGGGGARGGKGGALAAGPAPLGGVADGGAPAPASVVLTLGTSGRGGGGGSAPLPAAVGAADATTAGGGGGGGVPLPASASWTPPPPPSPSSPSPTVDRRGAFGAGGLAATIRAVFSHRSTVALVVAQFAHSWCHYVVLAWLPTFFAAAYGVPTEELGFTFLPYAAMAVTTPLGGAAADALLRRGTPLLTVRRRLHLVATLLPAVALTAAARTTTPFTAAASITAACAAAAGGATGGFEAAYLDVADPAAVGTLKAVANTAASAAGMFAVPLTGALRGRWGWPALFGSLVPVHLASAAAFWRWGGVDRVPL